MKHYWLYGVLFALQSTSIATRDPFEKPTFTKLPKVLGIGSWLKQRACLLLFETTAQCCKEGQCVNGYKIESITSNSITITSEHTCISSTLFI